MWVGTPISNSPCVAFGRPASFSLRFLMWAPLFPTRLALPLGALPCFRYGSSCARPSCQMTLCCVWPPYLIFVTIPHVGDPLANFPCVLFGHLVSFSLRILMWVTLFPTRLALCLVSLPHFRYDSSCGCPSCQLTLCCIWVPSLAWSILKKLSRRQKFSLSDI
jgi:hypothetical protein